MPTVVQWIEQWTRPGFEPLLSHGNSVAKSLLKYLESPLWVAIGQFQLDSIITNQICQVAISQFRQGMTLITKHHPSLVRILVSEDTPDSLPLTCDI